jgi:hypothetical protein
MFWALLPLWGKKSLPKKSLVCHISLHFCSYIQIGQRASTVRCSPYAHCPFLGFFTNFMSPLFILSLTWDLFFLNAFFFQVSKDQWKISHTAQILCKIYCTFLLLVMSITHFKTPNFLKTLPISFNTPIAPTQFQCRTGLKINTWAP